MMKNRMIAFVLATVAILLSFGVVSATSSCQTWSTPNIKVIGVTWGNSTHPISAAPGNKDIPLTVTLESFDTTCQFENVAASLSLFGGITDFNGSTTTATYYTESIEPPAITDLVYHLNIASNVTMGPNVSTTFPLVVAWDSNNGSVNVRQQVNVQVPLEGAANLTFKANKPDITAGKITNLTITVSNTGSGVASDIGMTITASSGVSLLNQPGMIPELAPGQSQNVSLSLYIAPNQAGNSQAGSSTPLALNTHYINPYGYNTTLETVLGLFASSPSTSSVIVSVPNQTLIAGRIIKTNLTVSNTGADPVTNLSIVLTPVSPLSIIGSDNLNPVPVIQPGSSVNLPITLFIQSSTSAVSTLDISLSYVIDNQQVTASRSISFLNPGNVNISVVSTVISPASPQPGQIFSITSTIQNTGSQSAAATSVAPHPPQGITILGQNSTFIGSVPVDTPTALTVSFTASTTIKAGTYTIPVVLSYLNNLNQQQNETIYYTIKIGSSGSSAAGSSGSINATVVRTGNFSGAYYYRRRASFPYVLVIIVAVVVVMGGAGFYLYRKRKKGKEDKSSHR